MPIVAGFPDAGVKHVAPAHVLFAVRHDLAATAAHFEDNKKTPLANCSGSVKPEVNM